MPAYWLTFNDQSSGCVEADTAAEALQIAQRLGKTSVDCQILPYPADPRLHKQADEKYGPCPSFCWTPKACAGRTSCPKSYACSE